ncbi:MAG TPA: hypothetical protein EYH50_00290 [Pyrodictium delaneyi]|uniref:Uncharacterized protein n=1 Tax=Pyrodictium delaneyi TaxID=1273541 RepID=A0A833A0Q9_9CREN|nr:hypothetical protein [Pyrodictium delaneyi]
MAAIDTGPSINTVHPHVLENTVGREALEDLVREITILASMSSVLDGIGIPCAECKEHFYMLLAEWARLIDAEYVENAAVMAADKKRDATALVDVWGEEGFKMVLSYVGSGSCSAELLRELIAEITDVLAFSEEASREFKKMASNATCKELRGLVVLALMVPPRG